MRVVDLDAVDQETVVMDLDEMRILEDGRLEYTQEGVHRFGPMFRRHGYDIRTIELIDEHEQAFWACVVNDLMMAMTQPPEEAVRGKRIQTHLEQYIALRRKGREAFARMHEESIYSLEGLTTPSAKELYFLCHIYPALPDDLF